MDSRTKGLIVIVGVVVAGFLAYFAWDWICTRIHTQSFRSGQKQERERQEKLQAVTLRRWNAEHDAAIADLQATHESKIEELTTKHAADLNEISANIATTYNEYEQRAQKATEIAESEGYRRGVIESHLVPMRPEGGYAKRTPEYLAAMEEVERLRRARKEKQKVREKQSQNRKKECAV